MAPKVTWPGLNGQTYTIETFPIGTEFNHVSGVYIICRQVSGGRWEAFYVGEAQSLYDRLNAGAQNHDGLKCSRTRGATHIGAMVVSGKAERLRIETELRHSLNPLCNKLSVPRRAASLFNL